MLQLVELAVGEYLHEDFSFFWTGARTRNFERMEAATIDSGLGCKFQKLSTVISGCKG